jgi:hypothetical protein
MTVYPMIKDLKTNQLKAPLITAITTACGIRRVGKIEGSEIKQMADMLSKTLKESFTTYRMPEVCKAIELGAMGELEEEGDPYTVSVELCYKWAIRYHTKIMVEAKDKQSKFEEKLNKEESENQRIEKINNLHSEIIQAYSQYCESFGEMPDLSEGIKATYTRCLYNAVELTAEQEQEIFDKAKKLMPVENEKKRNPFEDKIFLQKKKTAQLQDIAESIALEYLFMEMMKNNIDLEKYLNPNEKDKRK